MQCSANEGSVGAREIVFCGSVPATHCCVISLPQTKRTHFTFLFLTKCDVAQMKSQLAQERALLVALYRPRTVPLGSDRARNVYWLLGRLTHSLKEGKHVFECFNLLVLVSSVFCYV
jgi:hypothetical protein